MVLVYVVKQESKGLMGETVTLYYDWYLRDFVAFNHGVGTQFTFDGTRAGEVARSKAGAEIVLFSLVLCQDDEKRG